MHVVYKYRVKRNIAILLLLLIIFMIQIYNLIYASYESQNDV